MIRDIESRVHLPPMLVVCMMRRSVLDNRDGGSHGVVEDMFDAVDVLEVCF